MATAEKTESYWRNHHNIPPHYNIDAVLFYGTWPHKNKIQPNHIVPLRQQLNIVVGSEYKLQSLGETELIPHQPVNYLDHAYELRMPNRQGDELKVWFVPVEGTRLAGEYIDVARKVVHTRKIVVLGMCAGLRDDMQPGELVMPREVLPNDTGQAYNARFPDTPFTQPDITLYESLHHRVREHNSEITIWETKGYTHEALRRQTRVMADGWAREDFESVDMETGLIFGAAQNPELGQAVPAAAILYIIDNPRLGTTPSESGHLLTPNDARALQYQVALEEIHSMQARQ